MNAEPTHFLERVWYECESVDMNHNNGSYTKYFTIKNIGEVVVKLPLDRQSEFTTSIIPRSKQNEKEKARAFCF
jgi:transposase-like protein